MSTFSRSVIAITAGLTVTAVAGCAGGEVSGGEPTTTSAQPGGGLKTFDPCSFFTPDDLKAAGVASPGEPQTEISSEPGCMYEGENILLTLYKNQEQTVDSYETAGSWDSYERISVNGQKAARTIASGSAGNNICSTMLNAGGGVVQVKVTAVLPDTPVDSCAKAQEIATKIEPRLPK